MTRRVAWGAALYVMLGGCTEEPAMDAEVGEEAAPPIFDPPPPECGNGYLEEGEQCDDGNLEEGDGCDSSCTIPCGLVWETTVPSTQIDAEPYTVDMKIGPGGEIIVAGSLLARSEELNDDLWLAAFAADGTPLWSKVFDPQVGLDQTSVGVAVADDGSLYLAANLDHGGDQTDIWIGAFDATGTQLWDRSFSGAWEESDDQAGGVAVSAAGNPIISGHQRIAEKDSDLWLAELAAADGSELWSTTWSGELAETGYSLDRRGSVAVGPQGDIWALASEYVDWETVDVQLLHFDPSGALLQQWAPQAGTSGHDHVPGKLSVHADGRVYFGVRQLSPGLNFWVHELVDGELTWSRDRASFIDVGDVWELGGLAGADGGQVFASGWLRRQELGVTWREGWLHRLDGAGQPICETRYAPVGVSLAVPNFNVQALAAAPGGELMIGAGRVLDVEDVESFWVGAFQGL